MFFMKKREETTPLTANYHTHTWRCKHAKGTEREYVETAIEAGMKILGFSDHTPYPFPGGYCSSFRMEVDKLESYVTVVNALRREYARDIEIHLGLETEYYPAYFEDLLRLIEPYGIEYMLLGQHFIRNELGGSYNGVPSSSVEDLRQYASELCEAMKTGRFLYLAHPDLFHFTGSRAVYEQEMKPVIETANSLNIPLEINLLGLGTGRHYPNEVFWKLAGKLGATAVIGCDAHNPEGLNNPTVLAAGRKLADASGLKVVDSFTI